MNTRRRNQVQEGEETKATSSREDEQHERQPHASSEALSVPSLLGESGKGKDKELNELHEENDMLKDQLRILRREVDRRKTVVQISDQTRIPSRESSGSCKRRKVLVQICSVPEKDGIYWTRTRATGSSCRPAFNTAHWQWISQYVKKS